MRCLSLLISPGQEAQIYNRTADDAITPDEVEAKARRVQEALARGEDFATLAADLGEGLNAQNGGDTGFFKRGSMLQELEGALERMQPGEVSGAIDTKYGTYFLKLEKRRPGRQQPFEDVAPEIRQTLVKGREEQLRQRYQEFVAELKEKYGVIVYSDYAR